MLLIQKLEYLENLTNNEKTVANYLLNHQNEIKTLSINQISKDTYTSLSTTVRLAQKCGYKGWKDLKIGLLDEISYLNSSSDDINANTPFTKNDNYHTISKNIAYLLSQSILDTFDLLDEKELNKAIDITYQSHTINIYGIGHPISNAFDFKYKMRSIGKDVHIHNQIDEFMYASNFSHRYTCSIFISYSGETVELLDSLRVLKSKGYPIIVITSIGENTFSKYADSYLSISTKEKLYSKIAPFSSNISIHYILDLLFSCVFQKDYDQNFITITNMAKKYDSDRKSDISIIKED